MYFQGEDATNLETTVLVALKTLLQEGLASPDVAAKFKEFGGIPITRDPERGLGWFKQERRPFIFITLDGDEQFGWQKVVDGVLKQGTRHEITLGIESICSKSCSDAEQPLRDALRRILETSYFTLRSAGLEGSKVKILKPEEHPDRRNPIQVTATVYTL